MKRMTIAYFEDGVVEHILKDSFFKPGEENQDREIKRMTEIIPTPNGQGFRVKWLFGPMSGCLMMKVFPTYELAVEYEIEAVNQMRKYEPELFANL